MIPDFLLPVHLLQPGDDAEIAEISGEPASVGRLAELGVRSGGRLRMLQPGSPCLILVEGTRLSLRGDTAVLILVRPIVV